MSVTAAEVLRKAAALIEPEGAWTQKVFGRDDVGILLGPRELGRAVCFCAMGAVIAAERAVGSPDSGDHPIDVLREVVGPMVSDWNDDPDRTQAEVVEALRAAADRAEKAGV